MARTVTLSEVRELVRTQYDLPAFSTTTWVTTALVNSLINSSLAAYYGLLTECYGDNYFTTSATITTSAGVNLSSLPSRCSKVLRLWWVRGTDDVVPISRGSADDLVLASYAARSWDDYSPRYRLSGISAIQWLPTPNAAYDVLCDHVAIPVDLSADGDTFEAGPGHEFFVVNDVCARLAIREEKDPSAFMAERARFEQLIQTQAGERHEGDALTLRDADGYVESAWERRNRLTSFY